MSFSIQSQSFAEPTTGSMDYTIVITRTNTAAAEQVYIQLITGSSDPGFGSADNTDFAGFPGSTGQSLPGDHIRYVTFPAGVATFSYTVSIAADTLTEGNETFTIYVGHDGNAANNTAVDNGFNSFVKAFTITDPSGAAAGSLAINSVSQNEGSGGGTTDFAFTVTRSGSTAGAASATYTVTNGGSEGSATSANDFAGGTLPTGTVNFADGASTAIIHIPVVADSVIESNETFTVTLSNPTNATIGTASGTGTINNDDFIIIIPPAGSSSYAVADVSVTEGDTLSQSGQFTITRGGGANAASVPFTIQGGGSSNTAAATAGVDYSAPSSGTISFAAGTTSAVVQFQVIGDLLVEGNEQFRLVLGTPSDNGSVSKQVGIATIVDNDVPAGSTPQQGSPGDDTLIAQTNPSILIGGAGNDTYLVHNAGDVVIENNAGGTDIIYTDVSYNLGSNEVEALSVAQQTSTNAINLTGNFVSQTIVGNYGDNILNGGSGVDTLIGLFGNDTYVVGDSRTVIQEQAGQGFDTVITSVSYTLAAGVSVEQMVAQDRANTAALNLTGNEFDQTIGGSDGANVIDGKGGNDVLIGFGGADTFAFTTALGPNNVDTIVDFSVAQGDRIGLGASIFAGIGTTLDANEFVVGTAATGATAQIVYNQATGQLFYDADGTGSGAAVLFAQIAPNTALTTAAFTVV